MYAGHQRDTHPTAPREWKYQLTPEPSSRRRSLSQPGASQRSTKQAGLPTSPSAVCGLTACCQVPGTDNTYVRYRGWRRDLKPNRMPVRPGRAQRHQRELRLRTAAYSLWAAVGPLARPDLCCGHLQLGRGETFLRQRSCCNFQSLHPQVHRPSACVLRHARASSAKLTRSAPSCVPGYSSL